MERPTVLGEHLGGRRVDEEVGTGPSRSISLSCEESSEITCEFLEGTVLSISPDFQGGRTARRQVEQLEEQPDYIGRPIQLPSVAEDLEQLTLRDYQLTGVNWITHCWAK